MARETKIKQGDTAPAFTATLTDGAGAAINLTGATALFLMKNRKTRELVVSAAATITGATTGKVSYAWAAGDTDIPGGYDVEIQITFSDSTIETFPNGDYHKLTVVKDLGP